MTSFQVLAKDTKTKARAGEIHTPHGVIKTPTFTPVGTQATVKSLSPEDLTAAGAQLLFSNTYHLHLRPGENTVKTFGGLARFMSWDGPTITDSGGFQVFSLGQKKIIVFDPGNHVGKVMVQDDADEDAKLVKITSDGVRFRSHLDGSLHLFTPEESIKIQKKLGADLILAFDECAPHPSTHVYTKEAMERTHEWVKRCLIEFKNKETTYFKQGLYGIIQGGVYQDLREASAQFISELNVDGIAIGGVSVGESKEEMRNALQWSYPYLPENKPRHLLGIGEIDDIFAAVAWGMDTFDCVIPTRFGRYGIAFIGPMDGGTSTNKFRLDITKTQYARDQGPLTTGCSCYTCTTFHRGYIHHLLKAQELLGYRLISLHNVHFLLDVSRKIRQAILDQQFEKLRQQWLQI